MFATSVQASGKVNGDEEPWQISETSGMVKYTAHGTTVHGHQFGLVKTDGHCDVDILWMQFSSADSAIKDLVGTEVMFTVDVDGQQFDVGVNMVMANQFTPLTTVAVFSNFFVGPQFIDLLNQSQRVQVTIIGPEAVASSFDIRTDEFDIAGFESARAQAKIKCMARNA